MTKEQDICFEAGSFGKFTLTQDPDAGSDCLYPRKIIYEPSGVLASLMQETTTSMKAGAVNKMAPSSAKKSLDMARLTRLVRVINTTVLKNNLDSLATHLV